MYLSVFLFFLFTQSPLNIYLQGKINNNRKLKKTILELKN